MPSQTVKEPLARSAKLTFTRRFSNTLGAKIVKLCHRIANVEFSSGKLVDSAKFKMYQDKNGITTKQGDSHAKNADN